MNWAASNYNGIDHELMVGKGSFLVRNIVEVHHAIRELQHTGYLLTTELGHGAIVDQMDAIRGLDTNAFAGEKRGESDVYPGTATAHLALP